MIDYIAREGGHAIRFDTDRYPTDVRLTAYYDRSGDERLTLTNDEGEFDLREVESIWHRRISFGAIDIILTPDGKHVFLELNPCGEFFWLERSPGLPISSAIADLLLGHSPRRH